MPELPQGTVTFAFTDIEGSTFLLKQLGDAYGGVLSNHRHLIREAFGAHRGVEIDTQGDAFFYAFARARDAVAGAARVQRAHAEHAWPNGTSVCVRIGLHTGEPTLTEEGYLGLDVVRAARLCGSGRGGQVLLSQVTMALVGPAMPEGVLAVRLGERELKDIDEPEVVYELEIAGVSVTPEPGVATPASPHARQESSDRAGVGGPDAWLDDLAARAGATIEARVRAALEDSLDQPAVAAPGAGREIEDELRTETAALFDEIQSEGHARNDE